jgi:hypothetical protein
MQNLIIDDGLKEFSINNDPNKVIRFNPADFGIIERINNAYKEIEKVQNEVPDIELNNDGSPVDMLSNAAEVVSKVSNTIKKQIDYIFDSPVSDVVFGNQSPLSMVKGVPYYERFLNAVVPIIEKEVKAEQEASRKRIEKYTKQVK